MDEKGFLIGLGKRMRRIITSQSIKSGKTTKAIQDGNREFITVLACCSAQGNAIQPTLIYAGKS